MASPSINRENSQEGSRSIPLRLRVALPLAVRRCAAFVLEVSLVATSALVPYSIGLYANEHSSVESVPLNPVVASTEEAIAKALAYPRGQLTQQVAPLTNLFWCTAVAMPVVVTGWQLYLLRKTGKTTPKRWLGIRVVTASGTPPGMIRVLWREGVGRWGLPVGTAYLLWRYTGAFPAVGILLGLSGLMLVAESAIALFHAQRRALHDKLSGTYVIGARESFPAYSSNFGKWQAQQQTHSVTLELEDGWQVADEDELPGQRSERTVTTIVLTSQQPKRQPLNLWLWMRRHPGLTLLIVAFSGMASVLGTFVGTQVYIQSQANRREFKQQDNQVFLALVKQLSSISANATQERQGAILALARLDDPRAVPFLVDLLAQERTPSLIDAIQQGLVSKGPEALTPLRRLNQSLQNDQETLRDRGTPQEQQLIALRQRATKRAIAKILTIYTGQIHDIDLSRMNLGEVSQGSAQITLVLDNLDLSGINLRSTNLTGASLRGSRFYGIGEDERLATFDDWISDLSGAVLKEADLTGATLTNVSMHRTNLLRAALNRAKLSGSRLSEANLSSAQLISADLQQAVLEKASFTGADLGEANLSLANLHGASLGQVKAVRANFSFANVTQSNWQGATLTGANFTNANLKDADFTATDLSGVNFSNAELKNAKLRNSNLSKADLRGANLTGTDFLGVTFVPPTPVPANQFIEKPPSATSVALVKDVNFARAKNLDAKQIQFICSHGGLHPQCPPNGK